MAEYKGSKLQMQVLAKYNTDKFEGLVNEPVEWLCPVDYKEFQLNSKQICLRLGIDRNDFGPDFWPERQPQWDGLAIGKETKTLYLIEAKAHLSEISRGNNPPAKDSSTQAKRNYETKNRTLLSTMKQLGGSNEENWLHNYYQTANRIAFLLKMKSIYKGNVKLVFVNFINDPYWEGKSLNPSEEDWTQKYDEIYKNLGNIKTIVEEQGTIVKVVDCNDLKIN